MQPIVTVHKENASERFKQQIVSLWWFFQQRWLKYGTLSFERLKIWFSGGRHILLGPGRCCHL